MNLSSTSSEIFRMSLRYRLKKYILRISTTFYSTAFRHHVSWLSCCRVTYLLRYIFENLLVNVKAIKIKHLQIITTRESVKYYKFLRQDSQLTFNLYWSAFLKQLLQCERNKILRIFSVCL